MPGYGDVVVVVVVVDMGTVVVNDSLHYHQEEVPLLKLHSDFRYEFEGSYVVPSRS